MMLHGTARMLTVEDCLVIAVWAFKTLVIHNHAYNKSPFLYAAVERKLFIETLFPPEKNFRVWLSRFNVKGRTGHMTGLPLGPNALATPQFRRFSHYAFTFSVGQFMFQAHAIRPKRGRRSDAIHLFPSLPAGRTRLFKSGRALTTMI
jgi:hypothetical protein